MTTATTHSDLITAAREAGKLAGAGLAEDWHRPAEGDPRDPRDIDWSEASNEAWYYERSVEWPDACRAVYRRAFEAAGRKRADELTETT